MRDSVPSGSYSSVCNVLRQWKSRSSLLIESVESTDSMIYIIICIVIIIYIIICIVIIIYIIICIVIIIYIIICIVIIIYIIICIAIIIYIIICTLL